MLTEQDRQWVGAIVEKAAIEILQKGKDFTCERLRDHARECPTASRYRNLLIGLLIGAALFGGGAGLEKLVALL